MNKSDFTDFKQHREKERQRTEREKEKGGKERDEGVKKGRKRAGTREKRRETCRLTGRETCPPIKKPVR